MGGEELFEGMEGAGEAMEMLGGIWGAVSSAKNGKKKKKAGKRNKKKKSSKKNKKKKGRKKQKKEEEEEEEEEPEEEEEEEEEPEEERKNSSKAWKVRVKPWKCLVASGELSAQPKMARKRGKLGKETKRKSLPRRT